jgi:DNA-binding transcriptional LysR family regulator
LEAPEIGVREHLARGALVVVPPRYRPEPMSLSLLYAHRRNLPKRVRVFMDWIAEILRPVLARG